MGVEDVGEEELDDVVVEEVVLWRLGVKSCGGICGRC